MIDPTKMNRAERRAAGWRGPLYTNAPHAMFKRPAGRAAARIIKYRTYGPAWRTRRYRKNIARVNRSFAAIGAPKVSL